MVGPRQEARVGRQSAERLVTRRLLAVYRLPTASYQARFVPNQFARFFLFFPASTAIRGPPDTVIAPVCVWFVCWEYLRIDRVQEAYRLQATGTKDPTTPHRSDLPMMHSHGSTRTTRRSLCQPTGCRKIRDQLSFSMLD